MAEREVHLRDYIAIIRKHSFVVIISFLLIFGAALIMSLYMPRKYEATATIEILPTSKPSGLPSLMQSVMSSGVDQVSMETVSRRFVSRPILAETIRNLKRAMPEMMDNPLAPEALAGRIETGIIPDTRMIELTVRMARDEGGSERALRIANELISVMQTHRSAKADAKMENRQNFIEGKMDEAEAQIKEADQTVRQFLNNSGGPLVWSAQSRHLMERLSSLMELKERSQTRVIFERRRIDELKSRLENMPEWVESSRSYTRDALWDKYRIDLADLRKRLASERTTSGEKNPRIESLEAQIAEREESMRDIAQEAMFPSGRTESLNPAYQTLLDQKIEAELNLIAFDAQLELADEMLFRLNKDLELTLSEMPEKQFQLDKMNREIEYIVEVYKSLLDKKIEAELWASENRDDAYGNVRGGIEIIDTAQPGGSPVSPRTNFIAAVAGLVGLVVGLGMAFLSEYFENTYQSPEEAKDDLNIPLLGTIPLLEGQKSDGFALPVLEKTGSVEAESFRTLVANIEFSSPGKPYKSLLLTSSSAGEGKSFAAANLAVAMAQARGGVESASSGRVALVDCDMRKAVQHRIFGVNNQIGLSNLLVEGMEAAAVIKDTEVPNLSLITCGPIPPNPVELLESQRMDKVMAELRDSFSLLIFDAPPILPVADALVVASKLDAIIFLADLKRAPREVLKRAKEQLSKLDTPLLGLVCNRIGTARYSSYYHYKSMDKGDAARTING